MKNTFLAFVAVIFTAFTSFGQGQLGGFRGLPGIDYTKIDATLTGPAILGRVDATKGRVQVLTGSNLSSALGLASGSESVTDGGTNTLFTLALATNTSAGLEFVSTVILNDGTNYQSQLARVSVEAVNKGGTITTYVTQTGSTNGAVSSGTITSTYTAVASGGNSVLVKVAADSSLTSTNAVAKWKVLSIHADGTGAITD
jgi:hypothetical protein